MGFFDDLFGGDSEDPMKAANPYFKKAEDAMRKYMQPYVDIGMDVAPGLQSQYASLMNNPAAMLEMFMSGYEPSKGYQMQQDYMSQAAANSAAAGGMRGSPLEQKSQQELTQALLNQDMQKYLGNVTGLYQTGLEGNQGLFNTGFNASSGLSSDLSNLYGTQASMAYGGARQGQANKQNMLGSLLGMGVGLGASMIPGGSAAWGAMSNLMK